MTTHPNPDNGKEQMEFRRKDHNPAYKLAKIFSKTKKVGECMEWQGGFFKKYKEGKEYWQYPQLYFKGKNVRGNRLVWTLINGEIPKGMLVCHKCNNPKCLNPDHLYLGTHLDNIQDAIKSGTWQGDWPGRKEREALSRANALRSEGKSE